MRLACWSTLLLVLFSLASPPAAVAADYTPTAADIAEIDRVTGDYYHALDAGDFKTAYAMQTPALQAVMSFEHFEALQKDSAEGRGPVKARMRTGVTWFLDPPDAEGPGLYVAVDFTSQHVTVADAKEYVIWYRPPGTSTFRLMRHEQLADMRMVAEAPPPASPPLPETEGNAIGYGRVADARAGLSARKDVSLRPMQDGWLVVEVPSENAVWSFAPPGHPAYPAAVKRFTYEKDGSVKLGMSALCEASKAACDELIRQFQALNDAAIKSAQGKMAK